MSGRAAFAAIAIITIIFGAVLLGPTLYSWIQKIPGFYQQNPTHSGYFVLTPQNALGGPGGAMCWQVTWYDGQTVNYNYQKTTSPCSTAGEAVKVPFTVSSGYIIASAISPPPGGNVTGFGFRFQVFSNAIATPLFDGNVPANYGIFNANNSQPIAVA